eukprot:119256-Rhodomonas_salina.1
MYLSTRPCSPRDTCTPHSTHTALHGRAPEVTECILITPHPLAYLSPTSPPSPHAAFGPRGVMSWAAGGRDCRTAGAAGTRSMPPCPAPPS